jgi:hypothetical protein
MSSPLQSDAESLLVNLAEQQRTRRFGKYRGQVKQVGTDDNFGCITALVPAVFGDQETPWALPALPFAGPQHGLVLLPEPGDGVWIEFEAGNTAVPIWTGFWWKKSEAPQPQAAKARLLATKPGHYVLLDEDNDKIVIHHPGGAEIAVGASEISLSLGGCSLKITSTEINLNDGMVKVTKAGASLVNDAFKVGG